MSSYSRVLLHTGGCMGRFDCTLKNKVIYDHCRDLEIMSSYSRVLLHTSGCMGRFDCTHKILTTAIAYA
jgi:hypothetical protein